MLDKFHNLISRKSADYLRTNHLKVVADKDHFKVECGCFDTPAFTSAINAGAIYLEEDGSIVICEDVVIRPGVDVVRTRRKLENYLRQRASAKDIIALACWFGVNI